MKPFTFLPLIGLGACFVIPDAEVMSQVAIEPQHESSTFENLPSHDNLKHIVKDVEKLLFKALDTSKDVLGDALEAAAGAAQDARHSCHKTAFDAKAWVESNTVDVESKLERFEELGKKGHHHKPNKTIYELVSESKYTTKLAALINEYDDLVKILNGTAANYTLFAPIDSAFDKIPDKAPKPSKEELLDILLYHASSEFYPAGRVLVTHTVPTLLDGKDIGGKPQRLSTNIGFKGLTVNFYSRIIAIDIVGAVPSIAVLD